MSVRAISSIWVRESLTDRKWWALGRVPASVISGAMSVEKPDSRMAALSMLEVRDRGREGVTLTTALLLSGGLEDINTRCCLPVCVMCELMTHQAGVVLRGNQARPVSEGETLSQSPILPFRLCELICFKSGEVSQKTQTTFATDSSNLRCAVNVSHSYFLF